IEMRPDLKLLAEYLGLEWTELVAAASTARNEGGDGWSKLSARQTAVLALDRLNATLGAELGSEFELGHGLIMPLADSTTEQEAWNTLAAVWDDVVFPQIEDRFSGRPELLLQLLKVDQPPTSEYAWQLRESLGGQSYGRAMTPA